MLQLKRSPSLATLKTFRCLGIMRYGQSVVPSWDRHTSCLSPHPFCARQDGSGVVQLIAWAIPQGTIGPNEPNLIGIYFSRVMPIEDKQDGSTWDVMDYMSRMMPRDAVPHRKLVVWPPRNGIYPATYGRIIDPVEGDYSTGRLDPDTSRPVNDCNPEPSHCQWQYWESQLTKGDLQIPRFHCLQLRDEWWIVDIDGERMQQVAALDYADSPSHNFGIHRPRNKPALFTADDPNSEYGRILAENLPRL